MTTCFVVSTDHDDAAAVYEFAEGYVSLVNNRHFKMPAVTLLEAQKAVEEHAPKFLSNKTILKISTRELQIGVYHPSIARPVYRGGKLENKNFQTDRARVARIKRDIRLLSYDLEQCFDVSSPDVENFKTYGVSYESIILFACIGIENLFAKVLRDNEFIRERYNTKHFVKLNPVMRLNEYRASLARYPWLDPFSPFLSWNEKEPSKSLAWVEAYNKLKHDKMESHKCATMVNAINACLGYWILLHAVYGDVDSGYVQSDDDDFYIVSRPKWDIEQHYYEPIDGQWTVASAHIV